VSFINNSKSRTQLYPKHSERDECMEKCDRYATVAGSRLHEYQSAKTPDLFLLRASVSYRQSGWLGGDFLALLGEEKKEGVW